MRVEMSFRLPYVLTAKRRWILASCPVLDVHSQGGSEAAATENLREALYLFLEGCIKMGTLEHVLRESGSRIAEQQPSAGGEPTIEVTLGLDGPAEVLKAAV